MPSAQILLIDDDALLRKAVADVLQGAGYQVSAVGDGAQGLDLLRAGLQVELIVLDLLMPVMNGWQFRTLQRKDPTLAAIPVLAISESESPQATAMSAEAFLLKPLDAQLLLATAARLIDAGRREALPRTEQPAPAGATSPRPPRGPARRLSTLASHRPRLLIIDDEEAINRSMERLLRRDHQVQVLASVREAVELVRKEPFDLILCDLHMPDLTGQEFWEMLKLAAPEQAHRVAFMTAGVLNTRMMEFTRTVPCPVVEKPLLSKDIDELLRYFATH